MKAVSGVNVRPASPDDVPAMKVIFRRASWSNTGDRELLVEHPEYLEYEPRPDGAVTVLAVAGRQLLGFASASCGPDEMELVDLFVDPDVMRRGIGRALVYSIAAEARARGLCRLEVEANTHALTFYERVGFVSHGEVAVERGIGVRMSLDLTTGLGAHGASRG